MTTTTLLAIALGTYALILLGLSVYAGRKVENEEDYLVAGRRLPLWLAWGTLLATWFGAATMLGAAEAARNEGVRGTLLDPFASGLALIVAGLFFAKPLWNMRLTTMGDFYGRVYGQRAEIVASIIIVPSYFGWVAAQYVALGAIQQTYFGIDPKQGMVYAAALVLVYTMIGGMWSVTLTDTLQCVIALATLTVLTVTTFAHLGGGGAIAGTRHVLENTDPEFLTILPAAGAVALAGWLGTLGSGVLGNIPGQDLMQRVFSSKDAVTARRACVLSGVFYLLFGLMPVGLGLASRFLVPEQSEEKILTVLSQNYLSQEMTLVFVVALVSMIVSTCTSAVLSPAAILGHNLLGKVPRLRGRKLLIDRFSVFLVSALSLWMAFGEKSILELLDVSLSIMLVAFFVPLTAGLYGRPRGELSGMLAMSFGAAVWLARELMEGVLLPLSASAEKAGTEYADFVADWAAALPAPIAGAVWLFALLPSAISGTLASLIGYLIGQWVLPKRAEAEIVTN